MLGEDKRQRGILRGYLFEIAVLELLRKSGFTIFHPDRSSPDYNVLFKEDRTGFVELRGRGCWHQIDCPCDYYKITPFTYPMRILGEVKYHSRTITKESVREYIGVLKDIQENWIVSANSTSTHLRPRLMEVGVFFSATGFEPSAEHLAYAHGIKTISYANNHLINNIKVAIDDLEANHLSVTCLKDWAVFRQLLIEYLRSEDNKYTFYNTPFSDRKTGNEIHISTLKPLRNALHTIKTTFFATTASGLVLQFFSEDPFPSHLFRHTDRGRCRVYYETKGKKRYFWLKFSDVDQVASPARFSFTPPISLDMATVHGGSLVLNEEEHIFKYLTIDINLDGISRNLIIELDSDWFDPIEE